MLAEDKKRDMKKRDGERRKKEEELYCEAHQYCGQNRWTDGGWEKCGLHHQYNVWLCICGGVF